MPAIEVVLLGTGSPIPDAHRAGPSTLVRAGPCTFLVDAGRGVLLRTAAAGSGAGQLTATLLTHLHSDHLTDLNDVDHDSVGDLVGTVAAHLGRAAPPSSRCASGIC